MSFFCREAECWCSSKRGLYRLNERGGERRSCPSPQRLQSRFNDLHCRAHILDIQSNVVVHCDVARSRVVQKALHHACINSGASGACGKGAPQIVKVPVDANRRPDTFTSCAIDLHGYVEQTGCNPCRVHILFGALWQRVNLLPDQGSQCCPYGQRVRLAVFRRLNQQDTSAAIPSRPRQFPQLVRSKSGQLQRLEVARDTPCLTINCLCPLPLQLIRDHDFPCHNLFCSTEQGSDTLNQGGIADAVGRVREPRQGAQSCKQTDTLSGAHCGNSPVPCGDCASFELIYGLVSPCCPVHSNNAAKVGRRLRAELASRQVLREDGGEGRCSGGFDGLDRLTPIQAPQCRQALVARFFGADDGPWPKPYAMGSPVQRRVKVEGL